MKTTNIDYESKYKKYKTKYFVLQKQNKEKSSNLSGGSKKIKGTIMTYEGYRVFYHEEFIENIPEFLITKDPSKPNNKILVIDNINSFDIFTKLYAKEVFDKKYMYVKWNNVAKNFLGFYIDRSNKDLYLICHDLHNYKDKDVFKSWWFDYDQQNVIIFDNPDKY